MKKLKLDIVGLSYSQTQSGAYALVLGEVNGRRRLPIIIGAFEAQAIAIEIEKMTPSRPLTHDLFNSLAGSYSIYTYEFILATAGIVIEGNEFVFLENIEDPSEEKAVGTSINFSSLSEDELKAKLIDALADEAYEKAAKIRDELSRRKSS